MVHKYDPLAERLSGSAADRLTLTFAELDDLVGGLPASARSYAAWWANERQPRHVQAQAWLGAGYRVDEAILDRHVVFLRDR